MLTKSRTQAKLTRWQAKNGPFPTLMYITVSEYRRDRLKALMTGMKAEVMSFNDLK